MEEFSSTLTGIYWFILIVGIIQLVITVVLIIKFLKMSSDINALRKTLVVPKEDSKKVLCKWIACGRKEKAIEILMEEISASEEFGQLVRGGNEKYIESVKERLNKKYEADLKLVGLKLDLDSWV